MKDINKEIDETLHPARGKVRKTDKRRRGHLKNSTIIEAIRGSLGNMSYIARKLGVTRMTIYTRIKKSPELKEAYDEENETMLDNAENEIITLMNPSVNEDPRSRFEALKFYLDCKGKKRGYGRQSLDMNFSENESGERKPLRPILIFKESDRDKKEEE